VVLTKRKETEVRPSEEAEQRKSFEADGGLSTWFITL